MPALRVNFIKPYLARHITRRHIAPLIQYVDGPGFVRRDLVCQIVAAYAYNNSATMSLPSVRDPVPQAALVSHAERQMAKHLEFENVAAGMRNAQRTREVTSRGTEQHVVRTEDAIVRWPVAYEAGVFRK